MEGSERQELKDRLNKIWDQVITLRTKMASIATCDEKANTKAFMLGQLWYDTESVLNAINEAIDNHGPV